MFSRIWNFAERHRRKFLFVGVLVGGGILAKRYAERKLVEWQEREVNQLLERSRKQQHFESTERTCNMTIISVLPQLQSAIGKALDSDSITLLLKQKAPNKKDLWEQLKVIGFSRVISYVYCNALSAILLKTQVNVLGAYLYLGNQQPSRSDLELNPEAQSKFLSSSNHWLSAGVEQFCSLVERVASAQVANLSLKDRLTLVDLEKIFREIHTALEDEISRQPTGFLAQTTLPPSAGTSSVEDKMLNETREVMESREVRDLLTLCANAGLTFVLDKLAESLVSLADPSQTPSTDFVHPNRVSVYVAKLVPVINNFIFQDSWAQQLLTVEPLRTFGANIYESFSS